MELTGGLYGAYRRADVVAQLGPWGARRAVRDGELIALWPRVLVEAATAVALRTRAAAAHLAFPAGVLAGPTAAQLHGFDAVTTPRTHILMPYEHYARPRSGLVVHNGRGFADQTVDVDGLPVLRVEQVVADLLCRGPARDGLALADQALAGVPEPARPALRQRVATRIAARRDVRGTVRGQLLLEIASGRAESPPESWLHLLLIELGFPHPEINWPVLTASGAELYRLDVAWVELRVAVEYDGYATHIGREAEDAARDADLRRRGWIIIRVREADLKDPSDLVARLRDAFRHRGYTW